MNFDSLKIKKKLKRKFDEVTIYTEHNNNNAINDNELFKPDFIMDTDNGFLFTLYSQKGHYTYYSKKTMTSGDFYFEVTLTSLNYDIFAHIKSKCIDEIKKKYYDNILSNIKNYVPTVRIGIVNSIGDFEIPIGAESNSYAYRSRDGALIMKGEYTFGNQIMKTGDVIGCLVHMKPPKPDFLKAEDTQPGLNDINEECYIKYYVNGGEQIKKIEGIIEGSYHFGVTLYNYAEVNVNFMPEPQNVPLDIKHINYL